MTQENEQLKTIISLLERIVQSTSNRNLEELLAKSHYSVAEVAKLSKAFGTKAARPFTIRLACSEGRVPEAEKYDDNQWRIPREAVLRILSVGIPPERRDRD